MGWISGVEGLRVIDACLDDEEMPFPAVRLFPNLYRVIEMGISS